MPIFSADVLRNFSRELFEAAGVLRADAELVSHSLVEANLRGHDSHGVMRVVQYITNLREGRLHADVPLEILHETPAMLRADAGWGLGQVQAHRLLEKLIEKARQMGVAAGTLKHCGHTGRLGEYAEAAAKENFAFFGTVNSHGHGQRVAPPGGSAGRISTNPLCLGAPTSAHPLVLDIGTSVCAEGKVRVAFQKGEPVPEGWILDSEGKPTTDPSVLYAEPRGAMLPFGGKQSYKGFGLGLMLDLFAGGLSGGECTREDAPLPGLGNTVVFVVFDINQFGGVEHFLDEANRLSAFVRACPRAEGVEEILLPGDPEERMHARREREGISVADGTWQLMINTAMELGVSIPEPGTEEP